MIGYIRQYAQTLLRASLKSLSTRPRPQRRKRAFAPSLTVEPLEHRQLLAANQIVFDYANSMIVIDGSLGNDSARVWVDAANVVHAELVNATGTKTATFQRSAVTWVRFSGDEGDDRFENFSNIRAHALGGGGNDTLITGSADDHVLGGVGNDTLEGGAGNDRLYGEAGNDQINGMDGDDDITGDAGDDLLSGGLGADYIHAGTGQDTLDGNQGNDKLWGDDGNDRLYGSEDDDELVGGIGDDILDGGVGVDALSGEGGRDTLTGQAGDDWLSGGLDNDVIHGGLGDDYILGGDGNDLLDGDADNDRIYGEAGNDAINGLDGDDYLSGDAGDDVLSGGLGADYIYAGAGHDALDGNQGDDKLWGDDGNDRLYGSEDDDELVGGIGDDLLDGGVGVDALSGEGGRDTLTGQAGDDWLSGGLDDDVIQGGLGDDYILGGDGNDLLDGDADNDHIYGEAGNDVINGLDGEDYISGDSGDDRLTGGLGDDYLYGGAGKDLLHGNEHDDHLYGDEGDDELYGHAGIDQLVGGTGHDFLIGGLGDDSLSGEDGHDRLYGEQDNDYLLGGSGNDLVSGGTGDDHLEGGLGDDLIFGQEGLDQLFGDEGDDGMWAGADDDGLEGGFGDDYMMGGLGVDTISGEEGNDLLFGEGGNDGIWGGAGNDQLSGGAGEDYLVGGLEHDVLVGGSSDDELFGNEGNDILIGGLDVDDLQGEAGEDILIGGATLYDANTAKLQALVNLWSAPMTYDSRVQFAESQLFSARLQSEDTVFHDQVVDVLFGGAGRDWYFQTGSMPYYSPAPDHSEHDGTSHDASHQHSNQVVNEIPTTSIYDLIDSLDGFTGREANEAIHTLIPHADNSSLLREHLSLFELVRYDQVTHSAVRSGAWSDPGTWQNGLVPNAGARVLIPIGMEVRVDGFFTTPLATIRVDGTLSFDATRNTELHADTIIVASAGTFQMGTPDDPIASGVRARLVFTDTGAINRDWDPFGISRGLISHGKVSIYGSEVTSYSTLLGGAPAGSSSVLVNTMPVGWKINDTVVIAGTSGGTEQNETRRIVLIIGNSIYFDRPLEFSHTAPAANVQVHVANLTRNAVIQSQSEAIDRRGHVMFMHNRDVHISNAGFYDLGRTNKSVVINDSVVGSDWKLQAGTGTNQRARYPVHFHRAGLVKDGNPAVVSGSVVLDSPGWGFVNHSSYVEMTDNVAFDVFGSSFATEVGDEIGGFYGNIAIGSRGSGEEINARELKQDFGHQGDGFWFQGAGVEVDGNIAAGNNGHGFVYYTRGLIEGSRGRGTFLSANLTDPSIAAGAPTIAVGQVPVASFKNNVAYASAIGLKVRYHLEDSTHGGKSVFQDSLFWNNPTGVSIHYVEQAVLRNLTVIHIPELSYTTGVDQDGITGNITYENLSVHGYHWGIELPRWGNNVVNGGSFTNNNYDIGIWNAIFFDRSILLTGFAIQPKVQLVQSLDPILNTPATTYFVQDRVTLSYGPFINQQTYFNTQRGNFIPFPTPRADVPGQYVGKTNQQLWDQFRVAIGGGVAPLQAVSVPFITGGVVVPRI